MAKYSIVFKPSVWKDLDDVGKADRQRILKRIEKLAEYPRPVGCKKLTGSEKYRIRQDNYRILYSIEDGKLVIVIVKVGHRGETYTR